MNLERKSPCDVAAERDVLGACMLDAECCMTARELLSGADFYDPRNATVFRAIEAVCKANITLPDLMLVRNQLDALGHLAQAGGDEYLMGLTEHIATSEGARRLCKRVAQLAIARRVQQAALRLIDETSQPIEDLGEFIERAPKALLSACKQRGSELLVQPIADVLSESFTRLMERERDGQTLIGYATGFADLDETIGGLTPGDLVVLAARPAVGKTALATALKLGIARSTGRAVLSLELEMTSEQLAHRLFSIESGVALRAIRSANLNASDLRSLTRVASELSMLPLYVIEQRDTKISDLRKAARALTANVGPLALITVDYLQIVKAERREERREREVSDISAQLKSLAGEMHCPVLALSQLNRSVESRADKRPMLSDLRESGSIEQDADTVLFLYRDEVYNPRTQEPGIAEVIVGKQRSGPIGTVRLHWSGELTRFENLSPYERPVPQGELAYSGNSKSNGSGRSNGRSTNGHAHHDEGNEW